MLTPILAVLAGLALLVWSAERFVFGAAATAAALGVPTLLVGLVVVGFGTSAPELLVSGTAALTGNPALGVGNALGSNIANIALVLGTTALVTPLIVRSSIMRREFPVLLLVTVVAVVVSVIGEELSRLDGVILLIALLAAFAWLVRLSLRSPDPDPLSEEMEAEVPHDVPVTKALIWLVVGLLVLLGASRLLVWGAVSIAQTLGVSDLVIGLTIVAVGTSLPELAAGIASALKNEPDLVVGNVIGSNIFNTAGVMGLPALLATLPLDHSVLTRDLPLVCILTIALFLMSFGRRGEGRIGRVKGGILLLVFVAYQALLFQGTLA
ncbi:MAG: calcium/sodium antiporter [Gammaproteobacteria bacterium]